MKRTFALRLDVASLVGVTLALVVITVAQLLDGGRIGALAQPAAALIVFGGTAAALLLSYPVGTLMRAVKATAKVFRATPAPAGSLVAQFAQYADRARRKGVWTLETEIAIVADPFLARGLSLVVDGHAEGDVKRALEVDSRSREYADDENAQVLEAAAGYAPTLGILGAVLGLIHVMEKLAEPSKIGSGIAVAFVATVYGVGSANLVFLPLATKLRAIARDAALTRELIIEGLGAIQRGLHARLVEEHLGAYTTVPDGSRTETR